MNNQPVKISAVIITYNEESNIARCLESLQDVADEVVVVDSFSTDNTRNIAEKYHVRFVEHEFQGYVEQKNFALSQAAYHHILSLDADEELSDALKNEIIAIKNNWRFDGYYLNRLSRYCGRWIRHGAWHPDYKLRLFDRRKGQWSGLNPHDHIVLEPKTRTRKLKGKLLHYTYDSVEDHFVKMNRFSDIQAKEFYRYGMLPGYLKPLVHSFWRFVRDFFFKGGFLDGKYGYVIARNSAKETLMKYSKLREVYRQKKADPATNLILINTNEEWGGGEKWHLDFAQFLSGRNYNIIYIVSSTGVLRQKLLDNYIPVCKINSGFLYYINPLLWVKTIRLIRLFNPVSTVISLSNDLKLMGPASWICGVKVVIYIRMVALAVENSWSNRLLFRKIITKVIANSNETRKSIFVNNPEIISNNKISVIYNGIDADQFLKNEGTPLYMKKGTEIVLGNAGRLSPEKGQLYLLDVALNLKKTNIPFKILIAGEGSERARLEKEIRSLHLTKDILLLGFVEKIEDFYASIDVFVLTSRYEGFGYVLLEAGLSEKPVVAFDIGSSAEIVVEGKTGYLVPPGDTGKMTERIMHLSQHPEMMREMGKKAAMHVKESFDLKKSFEDFSRLFGNS